MKPFLLALILLITACNRGDDILFCEGTKPDGSGTVCGKVFSTGEFTAVYKNKKNPEADKFDFAIYETVRQRQRIDTITSPVKAGSKTVTADLSIYNPGNYEIEVILNGNVVAKSNLQIVDE
ncbi:MAG: hypothetical protein LBT84_07345 [Spirochaetia bacterium]|jgi:hypothetical protein|nr:hypothetical protein [Spirochaetia bacterium]